jgi:hypothetical protein
MESIWIPITLFTALMQTGRNGLMKSLKGKMHDQTIMLSRFLFSLPIVLIWLLGLYLLGYEFPEFNRVFFLCDHRLLIPDNSQYVISAFIWKA